MNVKEAKKFFNKLDKSWDNVKLIVLDKSNECQDCPERFKELFLHLMNTEKRQSDYIVDEGSRILGLYN